MFSNTLFLRFATIASLTAITTAKAQQAPAIDTTLHMEGKQIAMHKSGFPAQFSGEDTTVAPPLLTEPVHFHVSNTATHKDISFTNQGTTYERPKRGLLHWRAVNQSPLLEMAVEGNAWLKKGYFTYFVTFTALQDVNLDDIKLHLPFIKEAKYVTGLGRNGEALRDTIQWKWSAATKNVATIRIDDSKNGLELTLPYEIDTKETYRSLWKNEGKGAIWIGIKGKSMLEECSTGPHSLHAGDKLIYKFYLLITPNP